MLGVSLIVILGLDLDTRVLKSSFLCGSYIYLDYFSAVNFVGWFFLEWEGKIAKWVMCYLGSHD